MFFSLARARLLFLHRYDCRLSGAASPRRSSRSQARCGKKPTTRLPVLAGTPTPKAHEALAIRAAAVKLSQFIIGVRIPRFDGFVRGRKPGVPKCSPPLGDGSRLRSAVACQSSLTPCAVLRDCWEKGLPKRSVCWW